MTALLASPSDTYQDAVRLVPEPHIPSPTFGFNFDRWVATLNVDARTHLTGEVFSDMPNLVIYTSEADTWTFPHFFLVGKAYEDAPSKLDPPYIWEGVLGEWLKRELKSEDTANIRFVTTLGEPGVLKINIERI